MPNPSQQPRDALARAGRWAPVLLVSFVVVHALYYAQGVFFDHRSLIEYVHFLDPQLLRTRLIESLLYLHIQPPLFNLFAGLVLKITPESVWLFQAIFLGLGFAVYAGVFVLQTRLGVRHGIAYVLSTLFLLSPTFILFEHFLLYEIPCAALLLCAALSLYRFLESRSRAALTAFFAAMFLLCGIRTTFHWGWFALMWAALFAVQRDDRRRVFLFGIVPFLVLLSFPAKNYLFFGEFTTCTFGGKNLWIMTAGNLGWDDKVQLVEQGKLSKVSLVNRWASLDAYPPEYREVPERFRGIPALSEEHKSNGAVNYNHYGNIPVCREYQKDALYALLHRPRAYLIAVALSAYRYCAPATERPVSPENKRRMSPLIAYYDHILYGEWPFTLAPEHPLRARGGHAPFLFLLAGLPFLFLFGVYRAIKETGRTRRLVLAFMVFNIFMIAVLGCALDFTDTARYRFMTDGFSVALLGLLAETALRRVNRIHP